MNLRRSVITFALGCLGSMTAWAQVPQYRFVEYAAKFLCGTVGPDPSAPPDVRVRPGTYATTINIHNPQLPDFPGVTFLKKVVISVPEGSDQVTKLAQDRGDRQRCNIGHDPSSCQRPVENPQRRPDKSPLTARYFSPLAAS